MTDIQCLLRTLFMSMASKRTSSGEEDLIENSKNYSQHRQRNVREINFISIYKQTLSEWQTDSGTRTNEIQLGHLKVFITFWEFSTKLNLMWIKTNVNLQLNWPPERNSNRKFVFVRDIKKVCKVQVEQKIARQTNIYLITVFQSSNLFMPHSRRLFFLQHLSNRVSRADEEKILSLRWKTQINRKLLDCEKERQKEKKFDLLKDFVN